MEDFSLGLAYGYNDFDDEGFLGDNATSYSDWSVTLGYSVFGVDLAVAYVDTDLDDEECFGDAGICDATAVFSISKSF